MDLLIVVAALAFVSSAAYYIVDGISGERKNYKVVYTVKLILDISDKDKINVGDSVLSSDGLDEIGEVISVKTEDCIEYVLDRRIASPSAEASTVADTTAAETVTATEPEPTVTENENDTETDDANAGETGATAEKRRRPQRLRPRS